MTSSDVETLVYTAFFIGLVIGFVVALAVCLFYLKVRDDKSFYAMMESYEKDLAKKRSLKKHDNII